jgi:hypothetical protein
MRRTLRTALAGVVTAAALAALSAVRDNPSSEGRRWPDGDTPPQRSLVRRFAAA